MAATSAAETVPDPTPSPLPAAVDTIIIGAGVVGCCLAQRLARPGLRLLVVDGASAACAASGRSGGFLASDWSDGPLGELSALSFSLHNQLAAEFDGARRWGYRRLTTVSAPFAARGSKAPDSIPWLDGAAAGKVSTMGTPDTTAQITPASGRSAAAT